MADGKDKTTVSNREFDLKEYDALRKEILWLLKDSRDVERNVVLAVGAIWAWLIAKHPTVSPPWLPWLIPVLFAVLGAIRSFAISRKFKLYNEYFTQMESALSNFEGWDKFSYPKSSAITASGRVFWSLLILATVVAACIHPSS